MALTGRYRAYMGSGLRFAERCAAVRTKLWINFRSRRSKLANLSLGHLAGYGSMDPRHSSTSLYDHDTYITRLAAVARMRVTA